MPTTLLEFNMVGQLLTPPYQAVYWTVYGAPDYTGAQSGYFGQLQNIQVASTYDVTSPTNPQNISPPLTPPGPDGYTLLEYNMVANLNFAPYQPVYWTVYGEPDGYGVQSGYYGHLINIGIASEYSISSIPNPVRIVPPTPPSPPPGALIEYNMQGQLLTPPYQSVYWTVYNTPDDTGQFSGYFGQLQNIGVASSYNLTNNSGDINLPSGPAGGDLGGTYPNPLVVGLQGDPLPPPSGSFTNLTWTGTQLVWTVGGATPTGPAGGDLSGTYPNPTVSTASGHTIITNVSSAGGDLSGTYPNPTVATSGGHTIITNVSAAGGDLSGTYPNPTVVKLQTHPVLSQALGASQDGYALTWHNAGPYWEALPGPTSLPPSGPAGGDLSGTYPNPTVATASGHTIITNVSSAGGDLSGTYPNPTVVNISGTGGYIPFNATIIGELGSSHPVSFGVEALVLATDADHTLSAAELINPFLRVTSSLSLTATRNIILPATTGAIYWVYNSTTGGQSLTFKASSGTGVTVPNGLKAAVYFDGTNYVVTNVMIGGDLTATSNIAQTVAKIQGNPVLAQSLGASQDGYVMIWHNAGPYWEALPAAGNLVVTLAGDVTGPSNANTAVKINGTSVPATPSANQVLVATSGTTSVWEQISNAQVSNTAAIAGTKISPNFGSQVVQTTGDGYFADGYFTGVVSAGSLIDTSLSTGVVHSDASGNLTSSLIVNADVSASAAIAGTKISPNFGSQNIVTTGTLSAGATTVTSLKDTAFSSAGVVHNDASGNFTSSLVVNADVSSSAAIAVSKLAAGTAAQVLLNNSTPTPTWTTITGDVAITNAGATTVVAIENNPVLAQSLGASQDGYILTWHNAGPYWEALPNSFAGTVTLAGDVTGASNANTVVAISGTTPIVISPNEFQWNSTATPLLDQASINSGSKAKTFTIAAQSNTGAGNGGDIIINTGSSGSTSAGNLKLQTGGVDAITITAGTKVTIAPLNVTMSAFGAGLALFGAGGQISSIDGTAGQIMMMSGAPTPTWTTVSGDITLSNTGAVTVTGIQSIAVPSPSGSNTVLTYNSGAYSWTTVTGGSVTWANDLVNSTSTNQYVSSLSYSSSSAGGTISINGTGSALQWASNNTGPVINQAAAASTSSSGSNGVATTITAQAGQATTGSSTHGGTGGSYTLSAGAGGSASGGTNSNGGAGGNTIISSGAGGAKSGSGTVGANGNISLQLGGTELISISGATIGNVVFTNTAAVPAISQTAPASSSSTGTAANPMSMTAQTGGATTGSATTAGAGGNNTIAAGAGGSGSGGTNANGGAGGNVVLTAGAGGAKSGSGTVGTSGFIVFNNTQRRVVSSLKTATYTIVAGQDDIIGIGTLTGAITVNLPASPTTGDQYTITDVNGTINQYNVTISPNSGNINNAASFVMKAAGQSITIVYTGSQWSII